MKNSQLDSICGRPRLSTLAAMAILLSSGIVTAHAQEYSISDSSAVQIQQDDYSYGGSTDVSTTGTLDVNFAQVLSDESGVDGGATSGYINVKDSSGNWVVQNLPVTSASPDLPGLATDFSLGGSDGTVDTTQNEAIDFSVNPVTSYSPIASDYNNFGVTAQNQDPEGFGGPDPGGVTPSPVVNALNFQSNGVTTSLTYEQNVPNVQAANNQCLPAAEANGLTYLKTSFGTALPASDVNSPGRGVPGTGALLIPNGPGAEQNGTTLVGRLDITDNRNSASRVAGPGVDSTPGMTGLLQYLVNSNLQNNVAVQYQGANINGSTMAATLNNTNGAQMTATLQGATVTFNYISSQIASGSALQMGEVWQRYNAVTGKYSTAGGHFTEIFGDGQALGVPYIIYKSDLAQTDIDANDSKLGNSFFSKLLPNIAFLQNTQLDGMGNGLNTTASFNTAFNLVGDTSTPKLAVLFSEHPTPEPSGAVTAAMGVILLGMSGLYRTHRRKSLIN